jgi:hypothetical protein
MGIAYSRVEGLKACSASEAGLERHGQIRRLDSRPFHNGGRTMKANSMLNGIKHCTNWWREVSYFIRNSKINGLFRRNPKVIVVEVFPFFSGHIDVCPENSLSVLVKKNGAFGKSLNGLGVCGFEWWSAFYES